MVWKIMTAWNKIRVVIWKVTVMTMMIVLIMKHAFYFMIETKIHGQNWVMLFHFSTFQSLQGMYSLLPIYHNNNFYLLHVT